LAKKEPKKTAGSGRRPVICTKKLSRSPRKPTRPTKRQKIMTTLKVEAKQGEATSTYISVEQIVRADFYTAGRERNRAYAMVFMTDGNQYRVEGEQAFALETLLTQAQITLTPP
jgi:hypothetical protein